MIKQTLKFNLVLTAFIILAGSAAWAEPWQDNDYNYRKAITIDNSNMDDPLTDFPVYLYINTDSDIGAVVQADCDDIRFYDSTGTELSHEFETYNIAAGALTAHIWVKVPSLNSDDNTATDDTIWLYYGNASESSKPTASDVWDSHFVSVWHMNSTSWLDSTTTGNNGSTVGGVTTSSSGKINTCGDFDGGCSYVDLSNDLKSVFASDYFTVSAWVNPSAAEANGGFIVSIFDGSTLNSDDMFTLRYVNSPTEFRFQAMADDDSIGVVVTTNTFTRGNWSHVVATYDLGNDQSIYFDTAVDTIVAATDIVVEPTGTELIIGCSKGTVNDCDGIKGVTGMIDEVRISDIPRPAAWIKFEYYNINEADNELTWGGEEITIEGTVYTNEGVTDIGAGKAISLSIGGGADAGISLFTTETDANGLYRIGIPPANISAGNEIIAFIDGESEDGSTVSVSDGANLSGFDIYQDYVIVRHDNSGSMTNALMLAADNLDPDINYSVSGTTLTVTSGNELYVPNGHTFAPAGDVGLTSADCQIVGILTLDGAYTLAINTAGTLDIDGTLNLDNNSATIDLTGNLDISGTLDATGVTSTINLTGNWINSGIFTAGNSTVTLDGTNQILTGSTTFFNFSKTDSNNNSTDLTLTFDSTATQTINGLLTLDGLDDDDRVNLVSDNPGTQWSIIANGTFAIDYVDVTDSNALGGSTIPAGPTSIEPGNNNNNWTFKIISVVLRDAGDTGDYLTWALGSGNDLDTVYLMDNVNCVLVKNDGNVAEDFSIEGAGINWTLGSVTAEDQCVIMALFNGNSAPLEGDFSTVNDIVNGTTRWATVSGGGGNYEGANDGDNVAVSAGEKLYIYLKTPSSVTSGLQETITVTIGSREH